MGIAEMLEARSIPEPNSGCLLWTGHVDVYGYGVLKTGGRPQKAHRLAWQEVRGPIPEGLCVCHKCDVRSCINPDHLWLGTQAENTHDRQRKGRQRFAHGETHYKSRLTLDDVRAIRASSESQRALAKRYGVHFGTINDIIWNRRWKHEDADYQPPDEGQQFRGVQQANSKLSPESVRAIRKSTQTHLWLARAFGVSVQTIFTVRKRRTWRHVE